MNGWIDDLREIMAAGHACVVVTVAGVRGSAPREVGAKMLVTSCETIGTIGGGQLEYKCTQIACDSLRHNADEARLRTFTLGANCGQCCGGVVEVLFESCATQPQWLDALHEIHRGREPAVMATVPGRCGVAEKYLITASGQCRYPADRMIDDGILNAAMRILGQAGKAQCVETTMTGEREEVVLYEPIVGSDLNIAIFGAGHVGAATVAILASLDCNIRWIDSRRNVFPRRMPDNVQVIEAECPELEVAALPPGSCYLVMTHSHPLDQEIVHYILRRRDFRYCGLIGSQSKRRRFEKRLRGLGLAQSDLDRLTCPIGIGGISGKTPAEIAIAVAAEILQIDEAKSKGADEDIADNVRFLHR